MTGAITPIEIGLTAAIVSQHDDEPHILVAQSKSDDDERHGLPSGTFDPLAHRTFEIGLRNWVEAQTGLRLGYVEQLYTFGDRGRHADRTNQGPHVVSVGYLALARWADKASTPHVPGAAFEPWYRFFPWEDWRKGAPKMIAADIMPALEEWAAQAERPEAQRALGRRERVRLCFGGPQSPWDEEKVLERYELLYEAGLVEEARRDGRKSALDRATMPDFGQSMRLDHRRILATAIARLRGKMKYRPVVFELMPPEFTLLQLQALYEAILNTKLDKPNFRRKIMKMNLLSPCNEKQQGVPHRAANLYTFDAQAYEQLSQSGFSFEI